MKLSRRGFLRVAAITGSAAVGTTASRARGAGLDRAGENESSMLVDTTVCAGCRACEAACSEANGLPAPKEEVDLLKERRDTGPEAFTVVNGTEGPNGEPRYAKRQCMHCLEPACASVCPVRALDKQPNGPVVY